MTAVSRAVLGMGLLAVACAATTVLRGDLDFRIRGWGLVVTLVLGLLAVLVGALGRPRRERGPQLARTASPRPESPRERGPQLTRLRRAALPRRGEGTNGRHGGGDPARSRTASPRPASRLALLPGLGFLAAAVLQLAQLGGEAGDVDNGVLGGNASTFGVWLGLGIGLTVLGLVRDPAEPDRG